MMPEQLDAHLDKILKASGSSLKNYSMQKTKDDMREALRGAITAEAGPIRKALAGLVGVEGGPALDAMEASIRAAEAPQADKVVILDAIHILRETDASGQPEKLAGPMSAARGTYTPERTERY